MSGGTVCAGARRACGAFLRYLGSGDFADTWHKVEGHPWHPSLRWGCRRHGVYALQVALSVTFCTESLPAMRVDSECGFRGMQGFTSMIVRQRPDIEFYFTRVRPSNGSRSIGCCVHAIQAAVNVPLL